MSSDLLPCPGCGSDSVDLMSISMGEWNWTVGCNECGMTGQQTFTTVQAAAKWNALLRRPIWSKELPTEPGLYLWKSPGCSESLLKLYKEPRGLGYWDDELFTLIGNYRGSQFAGPIPEPGERKDGDG